MKRGMHEMPRGTKKLSDVTNFSGKHDGMAKDL